MTMLVATAASAQETYTVRGRIVRSSTGEGFAGVGLTSPNLKVSAMTGDDGTYEIKLPSLDVTLILTAPGYEQQVVAVHGRTEVDIRILDRLEDTTPPELNLHVSGPLHTKRQSGQPGSGETYFVRGLQSLHLSSQPLFVVDGVEWQMQEDAHTTVTGYSNSPLNMIDPDDIERVEILRDGSAIWGSKGAAGVVMISTKRAKDMATKIEANVSMGFQTPFKSMPLMEAAAYSRYATEVMRGLKAEQRNQLHFTENDPTKSYYWDTHQQTDWLGEVNHTAFLQNYGINVSGGDDIALYRFSLGYGKNNGNVDGTSFGRLNVRFNSDIHLTKRLFLAADIAYAQTMTRVNFDGLNEVRNPVFQSLIKSPLYGPWQHNTKGGETNRMNDIDELGVGNPIALVDDNLPDLDKYRFSLNLRPSFAFTDRLKLSAILGFTWDKTAEDIFLPDHGVADMPLLNERGEVYNTALNMVSNLMALQSTLSAEGRLDWTVLDSYRNDLRLAAGGRFYNTYYKWNSGLGYNTGSDFMRALSNTNSYLRWIEGDNHKERDAAWFLTANYGFLNKYFLDLGLELSVALRHGGRRTEDVRRQLGLQSLLAGRMAVEQRTLDACPARHQHGPPARGPEPDGQRPPAALCQPHLPSGRLFPPGRSGTLPDQHRQRGAQVGDHAPRLPGPRPLHAPQPLAGLGRRLLGTHQRPRHPQAAQRRGRNALLLGQRRHADEPRLRTHDLGATRRPPRLETDRRSHRRPL